MSDQILNTFDRLHFIDMSAVVDLSPRCDTVIRSHPGNDLGAMIFGLLENSGGNKL